MQPRRITFYSRHTYSVNIHSRQTSTKGRKSQDRKQGIAPEFILMTVTHVPSSRVLICRHLGKYLAKIIHWIYLYVEIYQYTGHNPSQWQENV